MLTRMDPNFSNATLLVKSSLRPLIKFPDRAMDCSRFDKLGPRADNGDDLHSFDSAQEKLSVNLIFVKSSSVPFRKRGI
jgi:hypothetical protein